MNRKQIVAWIAAPCTIILFVLFAYALKNLHKSTVLCIPNKDNSRIQISAQAGTIDNVRLKYNSGILQLEDQSWILNVKDNGVEYVRVHYTDSENNQHFIDFEIVISEPNSVCISKLNELGQQIEYNVY